LVSQMYKLKTELPSTKPTMSLPKTPIAPNRCCRMAEFTLLFRFTIFLFFHFHFGSSH
jgi:hypothetical protein